MSYTWMQRGRREAARAEAGGSCSLSGAIGVREAARAEARGSSSRPERAGVIIAGVLCVLGAGSTTHGGPPVPGSMNLQSAIRNPQPSTVNRQSSIANSPSDTLASGDVMNGWRIFNQKQCIDCHAVWGQGGTVGPDLGRLRSGGLRSERLAGVMWNHIPKMLVRMKQAARPLETISVEEMGDIFALINFVRQLDEPGDPAQGERILQVKGCTECHAVDTAGGSLGPDLAKWGSYANPVIWAQMMWEHAPVMEEAMNRSEMKWPELEGTDLVHIVAYVRSAGVSKEKTYLRPGSVDRGRDLFVEKKCNGCHPGDGPDLGAVDLPISIGALASRMWNHSPTMTRIMREKDVERQPVNAQELADILTYVLMLRRQDGGGSPLRGRRVFVRKGCAECHDGEDDAADVGPSLRALSGSSSPASMAAAMWNHGETMLQQMSEAGLGWPVFHDEEMEDLLAYLKASAKTEATGQE